jgi:hypothetical protein
MTENMVKVLEALRWETRPLSPNEIAMNAGFDRDVRRMGNGAASRGGWTGHMAPAQRIIGTLTSLSRNGYVAHRARRDGLSGTAYVITEAGRVALRERRGGA